MVCDIWLEIYPFNLVLYIAPTVASNIHIYLIWENYELPFRIINKNDVVLFMK